MAASEAAVAAVMEALGCGENRRPFQSGVHHLAVTCVVHHRAGVIFGGKVSGQVAQWTDRGCPVAVAAADAAVDADRASIQAETLREFANELDWVRPEKCPCTNPESCCGSEQSCDAMQPVTHIVGAINLRARADRIEGKP
jgi:hypothetical protein